MERRSGSPTALIIVAMLLVALISYGAGFVTPYIAGQAELPVLGTDTAQNNGGDTRKPDVPSSARDINEQFDAFWQTFQVIEAEYYYRPVDRQKMIYGAAKGMIETLGDDYSNFLTPEENAVVRSSFEGNFEGVGMWIEERNGQITVVAPIPNTPAERAGVRAKDVILAVDGRDVANLSTDQVASMVRGKAGTTVRIKFQRLGQDEPFELELTRERIEVPAVIYEKRGDYAWLRVSSFNSKATPEFDAALARASQDGVKGIILDLRNNGGGLVSAALEMLGRFLPKNTIAFYESRKADGSDDRPQRVVDNGPQLLDMPLVVLINGGSASASELVAGALQDYERATLIGEQSFGKGSEQHVYDLDDGSQARVTFAHWLTPKKRDINPRRTPTPNPNDTPTPAPTFTPTAEAMPAEMATATAEAEPLVPSQPDRGLTPDIVVVRTNKDYAEEKDPQLDRALEYLQNRR